MLTLIRRSSDGKAGFLLIYLLCWISGMAIGWFGYCLDFRPTERLTIICVRPQAMIIQSAFKASPIKQAVANNAKTKGAAKRTRKVGAVG